MNYANNAVGVATRYSTILPGSFEVRMGEVVQLRDYQRKDEPKPETEGEVVYCSPPIKDIAPCECSAPVDGDCA